MATADLEALPSLLRKLWQVVGEMEGPTRVILPPTNRESHREVETYSKAQTDMRHPPLTIARLTHALSRRCSSFAHPVEKHLYTLTDIHLLRVHVSLGGGLTVPQPCQRKGGTKPTPSLEQS